MTFLLLALLACKDEPTPIETGDTAPIIEDTAPPVPLAPTLAVVAPTSGAIVTDDTLIIELEATDWRWQPEEVKRQRWLPARLPLLFGLFSTADAHNPGEYPRGYAIIRVDNQQYALIATPSHSLDLSALSPGDHNLWVELVWYDGDVFFPPVDEIVPFTLTRE